MMRLIATSPQYLHRLDGIQNCHEAAKPNKIMYINRDAATKGPSKSTVKTWHVIAKIYSSFLHTIGMLKYKELCSVIH